MPAWRGAALAHMPHSRHASDHPERNIAICASGRLPPPLALSTIANVSGTGGVKSRRAICDFFPKKTETDLEQKQNGSAALRRRRGVSSLPHLGGNSEVSALREF